jgi:serpin B
VTKPEITVADAQAFTRGTTGFAWSLHRKLAPPGANFVASPASVVLGLGMVEAGAHGATADQLRTAVHERLPRAQFLNAANRASLELASRNVEAQGSGDSRRVDLQSINGVWASKGYTLSPDYLDRLARSYGAGVQLVDFVKNADGARTMINRWVSQGTRGKIDELLRPGTVTPDTRLLLVNVLYFWGSWATAFDPRRTSDAPFRLGSGEIVQLPTMHITASFEYGEGDGFRMLALRYYGDGLSMYVVLPTEGKFSEVAERLGTDSIERARAALHRETVAVAMPKFSFRWGPSSLKQPLQALGITDAFAPEADLSEMEPKRELRLADVVHATFISVAERGTEAAAATGAQSAIAAVEEPSVRVALDRPFLFFVHDTNGMILFSGQVFDPRQH